MQGNTYVSVHHAASAGQVLINQIVFEEPLISENKKDSGPNCMWFWRMKTELSLQVRKCCFGNGEW